MTARALIIAIENYPASVDLARTIAKANANAEQFFNWLTKTKGLSASNVYVCSDGGSFPDAVPFPPARESIVDAIEAIVNAGQDQTEEFLVYFSGHGYCFQESLEKRAIDVLVAADFERAAKSGTRCIKLQEVQEKLWGILGGQHHYYFIDACRTLIGEDEIDPIALGRKLGRQAQRGRPTKYTLYSTAYGTPAAITSDFSPALVDGLGGKGRAKGLTPEGQLWVQFPLLCSYVQQRVQTQKMDQNKDGNGEGLIVKVVPIPSYTCSIRVEGAAPADAFEARLAPAGQPALEKVTAFVGGATQLAFNPGNLVLGVFDSGRVLPRIDPPETAPLDFFDNCAAVFRKSAPLAAGALREAAAAIPTASVIMPSVADMQTRTLNLHTGEERDISSGQTADLAPGQYEVTVRERGMPIRRDVTTLEAGEQLRVAGPFDPIHASIVRAVHGDPDERTVQFSESLGAMGDRDLGLWLSIMGASHIFTNPQRFEKMTDLKLDDVTVLPPNSSAIYLLAAIEQEMVMTVRVAGRTARAQPVPDLTGVVQALCPTQPGSQLVSFRIGASEARTCVTYCLPNRVTFMVATSGSRGQLRTNQFILPMFHLQQYLAPYEQVQVNVALSRDRAPLRTIRSAYLFQAQFARSRAIEPVENDDRNTWDAMLYGKWIDPVMALLACYEIVRRGDDALKATVRDVVIPNLETFFPGIPDTAAIAATLGLPRPQPVEPPLFREGLLAFPDWEDRLPLPSDKLDFNYMWTTWRGP